MKKHIHALIALLFFAGGTGVAQCSLTTSITVSGGGTTGCGIRTLAAGTSGNTWTQKANVGGLTREVAVGFSIGNKGYVGTGDHGPSVYSADFWEYDPATNAWTQKANFAGGVRAGAVGFSIGSKGYVGTGYDNGAVFLNDFWEFNPVTNTWTQRANVGGGGRIYAAGFSIGNKGYIGTGGNANGDMQDFWEYNPVTDLWTQKANFGGAARNWATGFSIGNKGYLGSGYIYTSGPSGDFWEYDPALNTWLQRASMGYSLSAAVSFTLPGKGYVGTGNNQWGSATSTDKLFEFDPATNTWAQKTGMGTANSRYGAVAFSIGQKGYIATGASPFSSQDLWEYEGNGTYLWSNGATSSSITVSTPGTYSVILTSANGCTATASQSMAVSPNPTITISGGTVSCGVSSKTLTASGAASYTWSANAGAVNTASVVVSPGNTTTYTVSGTTGTCTISYPVTFIVSALPTIAVSGATLCSGQSLTLTPGGAATYTYLPGGSAIVSPTTNTSYSVTGANAYGCVSAAPAVANVTVLVSPTISVNSGSMCEGSSFTLNPTGAASYVFPGSSAIVSPSTLTHYTISGVSAQGCMSTPVAATVFVQPALNLSINGPTFVCQGQSITLTATGATAYSWDTGANSASVSVHPVSGTTYTVHATSGLCSASASQSVAVMPVPPLLIDYARPVLCAGESTSITASGADTYAWSNGSALPVIVISPTVTTNYTVTAIDLNGCSNSSVVAQQVSPCDGIASFKNSTTTISVYPNPNAGSVTVAAETLPENASIELYNFLGQLVTSRPVTSKEAQLNFGNNANGIYTLRICANGKTIFTTKIIKQ